MQFLDIFFKTYRKKVLALLLEHPEESFHLREIARCTGLAPGTLHRELTLLSDAGLIISTEKRNQRHYRINAQALVYTELQQLFLKSGVLNRENQSVELSHDAEVKKIQVILSCVDSILGSYDNKIQFYHSGLIQDAIRFRLQYLLNLVSGTRKLGKPLRQQLDETLRPFTVHEIDTEPEALWNVINEQLPSFRKLLVEIVGK